MLCKIATIRPENHEKAKTQVTKKQRPAFYAALLIDPEGVTGYEIFENDMLKGEKLIHYIENISRNRGLVKPVIVARKGVLSNKHLTIFKENGYEYIVGAALEKEYEKVIKEIREKHPEDEQWITLLRKNGMSFSLLIQPKRRRKTSVNVSVISYDFRSR